MTHYLMMNDRDTTRDASRKCWHSQGVSTKYVWNLQVWDQPPHKYTYLEH